MKKFWYSLTLILVTFAFIPKVNADACDLIYNISNVDFNGSKVSFGGYGLLHDTNNYSPTITISAVDSNGNVVASSTTNGSHGDYSKDYRQDIPSIGNTPDQFDYKNVEFNDLELDLSEAMTCQQGGGGSGDFTFQISVDSNGGSCGTVSDDMLIFEDAIDEEDRGKITGGSVDSAKVVTTDARVRENWNSKVEEWYSWGNNEIYDIADLGVSQKVGNKFLVGLDYGLGGNSVSDGSGKCVPSYDPSGSNPAYVDSSGSECTGYAKSNWLQFQGTPASFNVQCDDTPSECRSNINLGLTCSDGTFNATCEYETYSDTVWQMESKATECSANGGCKPQYKTGTASGTIARHEEGILSFNLPSQTFLSGTGFTFSVNYVNRTWYEWVEASCPPFEVAKDSPPCQYPCGSGCGPDGNSTCYCRGTRCVTETKGGTSLKYGMYCDPFSDESAKALLSRVIADHYQGLRSTGSVMFDDGGTSGSWSCGSDVYGNLRDGSWTEGEVITATCSYTLDNAYIHRKTAEIVYGSVGNVDDYLDRGQLYYIPLDWPTGSFGVYGQFNNLAVQGMVSTFNWNASYQCGVNNINRWDCWDDDCPGVIDCLLPEYAEAHPDICNVCADPEYAEAHPEICDDTRDCSDATYREEHPVECANSCDNPEYYYLNKDLCDARPGNSEHSFGFIYRPIDLYDPFPNRLAGYNWREWYSNSANQNRLETTYGVVATPEKLNYSIHLDPEHLNRIREYNDFVGTYLDYSINNDGTSEFFKVEKSGVPLEPSTNGIQGGNCPLGEYNETCGSVTGR